MREDVDRIIKRLGLNDAEFYQSSVFKQVDKPFQGVWTTVYSSHHATEAGPSVFACCSDPQLEENILSDSDWMKNADEFRPGFSESGEGVSYSSGQDEGFNFLVAREYFHPMSASQLLLNQEFILLFNLYRGEDGNYYQIEDCGEMKLVVKFGEDVQIRTSFLMRYIAAKQLLYVQFIDSRIASKNDFPMETEVVHEVNNRSDHYCYSLWFNTTSQEDYLLSMMYARSIVRPSSRETCNIWPFEHKETYQEFPIKENPDGSLEKFSCDPDGLNNYFDSNPGAPMYLTPVYFKPDVLDKYRRNACCRVSERRLECGSQWGVAIDNVDPSRVMVYLGDLGRDVPEGERLHFLEHAMSPTDQNISREVIATDFFNAWVNPTGPITRLIVERRKLDEAWRDVFGSPLYKESHEGDSDMEKLIRIPSGDSREEFDTVVLNLDKYLIEYIDETQFAESAKQGSLNRLDDYLQSGGNNVDISSLRDLQALRSTSIAHAKGKKYEKLKDRLLTGDSAQDIERLIDRLTNTLNEIRNSIVPGK